MASPFTPGGEIERSSECEEFVSRVINTRNYLTHYDQSLADNAYDGQEELVSNVVENASR